MQLIRSLNDNGKTAILISHNINQSFEDADHISVIFHGELIGTRCKEASTPGQIVSMIMGRRDREGAVA